MSACSTYSIPSQPESTQPQGKIPEPVPYFVVDTESERRHENQVRYTRLWSLLRERYPNFTRDYPQLLNQIDALIDTVPWSPSQIESTQLIEWKRAAARRHIRDIRRGISLPAPNNIGDIRDASLLSLIWSAIHDPNLYSTPLQLEDVKRQFVRQIAQVQREHNRDFDPTVPDAPSCSSGTFKILLETIEASFEVPQACMDNRLALEILLERHEARFYSLHEYTKQQLRREIAARDAGADPQSLFYYSDHLRMVERSVMASLNFLCPDLSAEDRDRIMEAVRAGYEYLDFENPLPRLLPPRSAPPQIPVENPTTPAHPPIEVNA